MSTLDKIKRYLIPSSNRGLKISDHQSAEFKLMLDELLVGVLGYHNGMWVFEYSQDFKETPGIKALTGFPDIDKTYKSVELWPFFSSRIPSLSRKKVKQTIEREGIAENDLLSLLSRFGQKTITNPFELTMIR